MAEAFPVSMTQGLSEDWPISSEESASWFERAVEVEPGGVQGEGRFYEPYPLFIRRARGARLWDVDGNEFLDYHGAYGTAVLGYNHPKVRAEVVKVLEDQGPLFAAPHPAEVELAKRIERVVPSAEQVAFTCSGTEATYHGIRLARAVTGREAVLKFEGHYHGWHDYVAWSTRFDPAVAGDPRAPEPVPGSAGIPNAVKRNVIVREFNDFEGLEDAISRHGEELAAVIVEPICHSCGVIEPVEGFLGLCRDLCSDAGIILIFDEVLTGFRHGIGGAQANLGVTPDLTAIGKAVANGFPLSCLAGRRELMSRLSPTGPVFFSGTYNGQVLNVAAALACTEVLITDEVYPRLRGLGTRLREGIQERIEHLKVNAQVCQYGSVWCLYFTRKPVRRYRDIAEFTKDKAHPMQRAYQRWMLERDIYIQPTYALRAFISAAHTEQDIDATVEATGGFLREYKDDLT